VSIFDSLTPPEDAAAVLAFLVIAWLPAVGPFGLGAAFTDPAAFRFFDCDEPAFAGLAENDDVPGMWSFEGADPEELVVVIAVDPFATAEARRVLTPDSRPTSVAWESPIGAVLEVYS